MTLSMPCLVCQQPVRAVRTTSLPVRLVFRCKQCGYRWETRK